MNKQKSKKEVIEVVAPKPPPRKSRPLPRAPVQAVNTGRGRLHEESRYLRSILDPVGSGLGSKIPDTVTCPSMPFTGQFKNQVTAGASGVCAMAYACSTAGSTFTANATSTPAALSWPASVNGPFQSQLSANAQAMRTVSAHAMAQVQGSSNNNQGRMIAAFFPTIGLTRTQSISLPPPTSSAVENSTYAVSKNVASAGNTVECRYIPLDPASLGYVQGNATAPAGASSGWLVIVCDGLTAGVVVEFQFTENMEIIPVSSNASIATATPSPSDPFEIAVVTNKLSASPDVAVAQSPAAIKGVPSILKAGGSIQPARADEPTFMERALGWAKTAGKVIEVATPIAKSLMSLL
jgi:hypothetical protein